MADWLTIGGVRQAVPANDVRYISIIVGKTNALPYAAIIDSARCFVFPAPPVETPLTLRNGWVNATARLGTASYYRDTEKRVHLQGAIKDGHVGNLVADPLPAGHRPMAARQFIVSGPSGATTALLVSTTGEVVVLNGTNTLVYLDGHLGARALVRLGPLLLHARRGHQHGQHQELPHTHLRASRAHLLVRRKKG